MVVYNGKVMFFHKFLGWFCSVSAILSWSRSSATSSTSEIFWSLATAVIMGRVDASVATLLMGGWYPSREDRRIPRSPLNRRVTATTTMGTRLAEARITATARAPWL